MQKTTIKNELMRLRALWVRWAALVEAADEVPGITVRQHEDLINKIAKDVLWMMNGNHEMENTVEDVPVPNGEFPSGVQLVTKTNEWKQKEKKVKP